MAFVGGDMGPCDVDFGGVSTGENTITNVRVSDDIAEVKNARVGTACVDKVFTGRSIEVEATLTQSTLAQLGIMQNAAVSGTEVRFSNPAGSNMRDNAGVLIVKRIIDGAISALTTNRIVVPIAAPQIDWDVPYDGEGSQRTFKTIFHGLVVETNGTPTGWTAGQLFGIGGQ